MIYLDNAAATPLNSEALKAMRPYLKGNYANSHSTHSMGVANFEKVNECRNTIGKIVGTNGNKIFFTSGATESNNWAIKGAVLHGRKKIAHTLLDHASVLESIEFCKKYYNAEDCIISTDVNGVVKLDAFREMMKTENPDIIVLTWVNNEIGTIQPLTNIVDIARRYNKKVFIHIDAVQALPRFELNLDTLHIDSAAFTAHKIHGPKGIGALYLKDCTSVVNLISGEGNVRPGTENVAGIVGFAKALEVFDYKYNKERIDILSEVMKEKLGSKIELTVPYAEGTGIFNLYLPVKNSSDITFMLDNMFDIMTSTGAACHGDGEVSHVINGIGKDGRRGLRVSITAETTVSEIEKFARALKKVLKEIGRYE